MTDDGDGSEESIAPDPDVADPGFDSGADVPDGDPLDIPLPWNTVPDEESTGTASSDDVSDADRGGISDTTGGASRPQAVPETFEDLRFVGPKTAPLLAESNISVADIWKKRVSYRDLTDAGVNRGVAAKVRREHSLSWSLDGGGTDLDRRSDQIRGLDDEERAWIAESSGWSESDSDAEADGSGDATAGEAAWQGHTSDSDTGDDGSDSDESPSTAGEAAWRAGGISESDDADGDARDAESAWRERSAPTPLTAVEGFGDDVARILRKAGIGSVRRLATADPESVADALDVDTDRVWSWRQRARDHDADG
ncbi:MAG: helix-hairpin-helix domain-containing protein [Halobellus sp.]|uniref:helix-hairpin-helix domain-containing protein n=1 Tax=Halobellus sp. TaxID=1979212 RepID=UPI0035D46549